MDKENRGRYGGWERGIKGSSVDRDGDSCSTVEVIKTHKANGGWMMCLFKYSSQVEDVSGGQALRGRTGLIFGVWMSQQTVVGLNLSPVFLSHIITFSL